MSHTQPTASSSNFQSVFNAALKAYKKKTKNNLLAHPLAAQLEKCDSTTDILAVLQDQVQKFDHQRSADERLTKWLNPTVNVLYAFSATLGEGVGLVFSPAKAIFAGIGVLLLAAKDVDASQDVLVDLFEHVEIFFKRLESYIEMRPTDAMTEIIVKVMVEVLSILAIATKEMKQSRAKKYVKKLVGRNDIEGALKRLDKLIQEEARMGIVENLKDGKEAKEIIQQTANSVDEVKRKQQRGELQKWLSSSDPSTNHNIARSSHHEGTATWFFQGSIFDKWKSTPSLLWIHGKPGSGKSILCSAVIEQIMTLCESGLASMAYFYFDFRDEDKKDHRNLLLSLLLQLSAQSDMCCDILSRLHSTHRDGTSTPSDGALIKCLIEMMTSPSQLPIYLVLDALDECPNNSGMPSSREQVLALVKDLVDLHLPNLHVCVTSRPEVDIRATLEPLTSLRVSIHDQTGQKKDIVDYVSSVVYSDANMRRWREEDKTLVVKTLSQRADGMFRWVYCQLETLRHTLPPSVRSILDELPETLDETYERVLRDINKTNRDHAHRLLQCLTVAIRPLRVEELAEVLAVDFGAARRDGIPKLNPNWRWEDQHQAVLSTCSSLITTVDDGRFQVVQFSHFSVKEFLTSKRLATSSGDISRYHVDLKPAHTILAQACLGVLLSLDDQVNKVNTQDVPLVEYAAQHWVDHAQFENVSSSIQDAMEYLFDAGKPHWAAWLRVYDMDTYGSWFYYSSTGGGLLYYAALCGFHDLVEHLVAKHPQDVNAEGGRSKTPLLAALNRKHFQVAELLHQHGAEIDERLDNKWTVLHYAVFYGPADVLPWLLNHGADVNAQKDDLWTPLHLATANGHFEVARMLLEHKADINTRNDDGCVALHLASGPFTTRDQLEITELLLRHGAETNARDDTGSTPLHESLSDRIWYSPPRFKPSAAVIRLLLEHGANIDAENNEGKTVLQIASEEGYREIVELLLEHGAKNTQYGQESTSVSSEEEWEECESEQGEEGTTDNEDGCN